MPENSSVLLLLRYYFMTVTMHIPQASQHSEKTWKTLGNILENHSTQGNLRENS